MILGGELLKELRGQGILISTLYIDIDITMNFDRSRDKKVTVNHGSTNSIPIKTPYNQMVKGMQK